MRRPAEGAVAVAAESIPSLRRSPRPLARSDETAEARSGRGGGHMPKQWGLGVATAVGVIASMAVGRAEDVFPDRFEWGSTRPLVGPAARPDDPCISVKDPTFVRFGDRWHLFCTIRSRKRSHQIEYLNFADWTDGNAAPRHVLKLRDGYFCAPQVFWFT